MTAFQLFRSDEELAANAEEAHAPALARGARCRECPLWGCQRGPVMGQVVPNSPLAVVGEAPGLRECEQGQPFIGPSGRVLNECLEAGGIDRDNVTISNTILCMPPDDYASYLEKLRNQAKRDGVAAVLPPDCCQPRLQRDLTEANATVELAVGGQALKALAHHHGLAYGKTQKVDQGQVHVATLRKQHGAPVVINDDPRKLLIASYHPAFAFRGAKAWMPVIRKVLTRAASLASRGGVINWSKPAYNIDPTIDEVEAFADTVISNNAMVTCDIETDGIHTQLCTIRCVGLGATIDHVEHVIIVPFHNMDGSMEWGGDQATYDRAKAAVRRIMDQCPLAGQNFSFDTSVMLRDGFMTRWDKRYFDTMLAHHDTDSNDLPHDLGFITSEYFEAPHHKDDADHSVVNNVDYPRLKTYCGSDVLVTMRLVEPLYQRILELGTYAQFETDTKLAPICRDMGDLGLVIDERTRQELATTLLDRCNYHESQFRFQAACVTDPERDPERAAAAEQALARVNEVIKSSGSVADKQAQLMGMYDAFSTRHGYDTLNPRSPHQLIDWLYVREGLTPQLNVKGFDYDADADDNPSTSTAALLKLQDKYPHTGDAIEALMEYRAYQKLYGTYAADKRGRIRDVDWTQWGLPQCDWLRILNTTFKLHVVPSGRLSSTPNFQNVPAIGKANMRTMFTSPPGHCMVGADYCLVPGTRILRSDLTWTNIEELEVGDELVGFDEYNFVPEGKKQPTRTLQRSTVEATKSLRKQCVRIEFEDGRVVTASADHSWLAAPNPCSPRRWMRTDALQPGHIVGSFCPGTWEQPDPSYEIGYLAGFFDGEGWVSRSGSVGYGQLPGAVNDYVKGLLQQLGFSWTSSLLCNGVDKSVITGCRGGLKFLSIVRPQRLLAKAQYAWEGQRIWSHTSTPAVVRSITHVGLRKVIAVQTSTKTFIAEGLFSHNCQLELRIYAVIAQDQLLLRAFNEGLDPHSLNAASLLCDHESQIMDEYHKIVNAPPKYRKYWRLVAKRFSFLELYGGEEGKLFATMAASRDRATGKRDFPNLELDEVLKWHERWHRLHPETRDWQQACQRIAFSEGVVGVCTLDYRKRFFPGGIDKKNAPMNHTIQGFAASVANKALIELAQAIPHRGWSRASGLCLQVHDYIGAYVPRERAYEAAGLFKEIMEHEFRGLIFTCTPEVSERWSDQG